MWCIGNHIRIMAADAKKLIDVLENEVLMDELLHATAEEIKVQFPEEVAAGVPFVSAVGRNNSGIYLRISQAKKLARQSAGIAQKKNVETVVSRLENADLDVIEDWTLGQSFPDHTLVKVQTLDRSAGLPVATSGNGRFGHIAFQPVYEDWVLAAKGSKDTLLDGVSYTGETTTKREAAESVLATAARKHAGMFTSAPASAPLGVDALVPM